jgi:hypothetical protein
MTESRVCLTLNPTKLARKVILFNHRAGLRQRRLCPATGGAASEARLSFPSLIPRRIKCKQPVPVLIAESITPRSLSSERAKRGHVSKGPEINASLGYQNSIRLFPKFYPGKQMGPLSSLHERNLRPPTFLHCHLAGEFEDAKEVMSFM